MRLHDRVVTVPAGGGCVAADLLRDGRLDLSVVAPEGPSAAVYLDPGDFALWAIEVLAISVMESGREIGEAVEERRASNQDSSQDTRIGPAEVGGEVAPAPDRRRPASAEGRVGGADNTDSGQEAR